jgi:hypothetical protein
MKMFVFHSYGDIFPSLVARVVTTFSISISADVRIFDDSFCRRAYGSVFDSNTEICAGDYNQRTDTMVRANI